MVCLLDGSLVTRLAVERCGVPRSDFFMMHEDLEYTTRIGAAGSNVMMSTHIATAPMYLGSGGGTSPRRWWRSYYQSRNHLRMVLDRRSLVGVAGWLVREGSIIAAGFRGGSGGLVKARLVLRAAIDAVRHRMGRTIEPGSV